MDTVHLSIIPFVLAMVVSAVSTPIVIFFYKSFGWVVDPNKTKHPGHTHIEPVPKGGGIPVLLGTLAAAVVLLAFDVKLAAILAAGSLAVLVGTLDDIWDINPYFRLITNLLVAVMVVSVGVGVGFVTNPLTGGVWVWDKWMGVLFTLLWIPFVMNAINWSKGLDGQMPGVVVVAAIVIGLLSFKYSADITQWPVAILAFAVAGAYAGYLPFNIYPQKSMPGYGGGSFAGFMLATLAILSTTKVGTALVVLGIPLIDSIFIGVRRIMSGKSPVWGDKGHLHHKLLALGWSKRKVAAFYWLTTAILGAVALNLNSKQKFYTMVVVSLILGSFGLWISFGHSFRRRGRDNG